MSGRNTHHPRNTGWKINHHPFLSKGVGGRTIRIIGRTLRVSLFRSSILIRRYRSQAGEGGGSTEMVGRKRKSRDRSEEQTTEVQSIMRNSYAVFVLKKKNKHHRE